MKGSLHALKVGNGFSSCTSELGRSSKFVEKSQGNNQHILKEHN
jgi:hypothetical protein